MPFATLYSRETNRALNTIFLDEHDRFIVRGEVIALDYWELWAYADEENAYWLELTHTNRG